MARLKETAGEFVKYHTSGHIFADDIIHLVKAIEPGLIVPIHTMCPEVFRPRQQNLWVNSLGSGSFPKL